VREVTLAGPSEQRLLPGSVAAPVRRVVALSAPVPTRQHPPLVVLLVEVHLEAVELSVHLLLVEVVRLEPLPRALSVHLLQILALALKPVHLGPPLLLEVVVLLAAGLLAPLREVQRASLRSAVVGPLALLQPQEELLVRLVVEAVRLAPSSSSRVNSSLE
jgi:hypothetical protein